MSVLTGREIEALGLVTGMPDPDAAYQPNGVDVSVDGVEYFQGRGKVLHYEKELSQVTYGEWKFPGLDVTGPTNLTQGAYLVTLQETVKLPNNVMAYLLPRSSLLRCGATLETAVWDAGYEGRGQVLLVIHNPHGFTLDRGARIGQLVFHELTNVTRGYSGGYQGEGIERSVQVPSLQAYPTREQFLAWLEGNVKQGY